MSRTKARRREIPVGEPAPVNLGHPCFCQSPSLPFAHTLGDHRVGDPKRPR